MWYRAGADLVVVVHLLFIGFIVGGVFLTLRWLLIIWTHIPRSPRGSASSLGPSCRRGQMPQGCPRSIMTMIRMHTMHPEPPQRSRPPARRNLRNESIG